MPSRHLLRALVLVGGAAWAGALYLRGYPITNDFVDAFPVAFAVVSVAVLLWDVLLWRTPLVRQYIAHRPLLRGTWETELQTTWVPQGAKEPLTVRGTMVVRQTFSGVTFVHYTRDSHSTTLSGAIVREPDKTYTAAAVYRNTPNVRVRDGSAIHLGAMVLRLSDDAAGPIEGEYWGSRQDSRGDIRLTNRRGHLAQGYEEWS